MTPDELLETEIRSMIRFENGLNFEVSVRPRKEGGVTEESMIAFRPVDGRGTFAIHLESLRRFARSSSDVVALIRGGPEEMTKADAQTVLAWLDGLGEPEGGEDASTHPQAS